MRLTRKGEAHASDHCFDRLVEFPTRRKGCAPVILDGTISPMRRVCCLYGMVILVSLAFTGDAEGKTQNAWPIPKNAAIWAVVDLPSGRDLGPATVMLDQLHRGTAAAVRTQLPDILAKQLGLVKLDGVDLDQPIRLVILVSGSSEVSVAALVHVANRRRLQRSVPRKLRSLHRGRALLGSAAARQAARVYLLGAADAVAIARDLRLVLFGPPLAAAQQRQWARLQRQLPSFTRQSPALSLARTVLSGLQVLLDDIKHIEIQLSGQHSGNRYLVGADVRMTPFPGSLSERLARAQKPSTFRLLGKLPALANPLVVSAGDLRAGPLRASIQNLADQLTAVLWGQDAVPLVSPQVSDMMDRFTGEMANALQLSSMLTMSVESYGLSAVNDTRRAQATLFGLRQTIAGLPMRVPLLDIKSTSQFTARAFLHRGVQVAREASTTTMSTLQPILGPLDQLMGNTNSTYYAAFDDLWATASGGLGNVMRTLINAARGHAPRLTLPARMKYIADHARQRGNSMFTALDIDNKRLGFLLKLAQVPMPSRSFTVAFTLGFTDSTPRMFLGVAL